MVQTMKLNLNLVSSLYSQRTNNALTNGNDKCKTNISLNRNYTSDTVSFGGITKQMSGHTYIDGLIKIEI